MTAESPPFSLTEGDLCIRMLEVRDAAAVQRHRTLPETARYGGWRPPTVAEVERLATDQAGARPGFTSGFCQLVIEELPAAGTVPRIVGDFGVGGATPGQQVELGVVLDPSGQGRGVATRACRMLIDWLFAQGLHRVTARVDPRNTPSLRLFERLGFRQEGLELECWWDPQFEEWTDEVLFAVLAREWPGQDARTERGGRSAR